MSRSNLSDIRKIVTFMRKNGILKYRNEHFEISLSRQALKLPKPRVKKEEMPIAGISEMDLALWSAR